MNAACGRVLNDKRKMCSDEAEDLLNEFISKRYLRSSTVL